MKWALFRRKEKGKKIRCYSHNQIQTLSYIHYLMEEKVLISAGFGSF